MYDLIPSRWESLEMRLGVHAQTAVYAAFLQNMVPSLLAGHAGNGTTQSVYLAHETF